MNDMMNIEHQRLKHSTVTCENELANRFEDAENGLKMHSMDGTLASIEPISCVRLNLFLLLAIYLSSYHSPACHLIVTDFAVSRQ